MLCTVSFQRRSENRHHCVAYNVRSLLEQCTMLEDPKVRISMFNAPKVLIHDDLMSVYTKRFPMVQNVHP